MREGEVQMQIGHAHIGVWRNKEGNVVIDWGEGNVTVHPDTHFVLGTAHDQTSGVMPTNGSTDWGRRRFDP